MSTAWVYGVVGVHPWQLARYPVEAQRDVWGEDSSVLVASTYMPVAKVTPVKGGYQVSGRWGFSSALIVKNKMIISDGYNGTPAGFENVCEMAASCRKMKPALPNTAPS